MATAPALPKIGNVLFWFAIVLFRRDFIDQIENQSEHGHNGIPWGFAVRASHKLEWPVRPGEEVCMRVCTL